MARAQVATGPLSSAPLPSGLLLGDKLCPLRAAERDRAAGWIRAYYTLLRLAPAFEPKGVDARLRELSPKA
jgi:hypothetical protein